MHHAVNLILSQNSSLDLLIGFLEEHIQISKEIGGVSAGVPCAISVVSVTESLVKQKAEHLQLEVDTPWFHFRSAFVD